MYEIIRTVPMEPLEKSPHEDKIIEALTGFGEDADLVNDVDICEDGSVWLGLTQILPKGSCDYWA